MKEQKKAGMRGNLALTVAATAILITLAGCDNLTRPATKPPTGPGITAPESAGPQAGLVPYADEKRISFAGRAPRAGRTLVFPRAQCKYALYMNYLHKWLDRPLFQDNALWENDGLPNHKVMKYPSSRKTMDIVNSYDVDGLACIYAKGMDYGLPLFEYADRDGRDNFRVVPEFGGEYSEAAFANNLKVVQVALASKSAARIDGKILITSYRASGATPEQWKEMLGRLREKVGNTFIFLPDVAGPAWGDYETKSAWKDPHYKEGVADKDRDNSVKEYLRVKERLRAYLEACDGLYFGYGHGLSKKDHTFAAEFYREAVASVFSSLKEDPQYKDKYFGLSAGLGHFNPGQGPRHSADGTRTLRWSFETALSINPDVIILPEWDEVNENTCVQPTVYRSFSTQRILKYYMSIIKHKLPSPNPGDDLGVPNLILSYRKVLALGEKLELEILNVPDGKFSYLVNCELALKDNSGQIVKQFPPFTLYPHKLQEERITVPTEDLRAYHIFRPVLTVKAGAVTRTYELGLPHIQLYPTYNWNKLWVNQPLRDLADMRRADISAENAGEELLLKGALACGEPLASVEILEDDDEIWAYDVDDEFSRNQDTVQILFTLRSHCRKDISGSITASSKSGGVTAPNTEAKWFRLSFFEFTRSRIPGNEWDLTGNADWWPTYKLDWLSRTSLLVLPRKDVTNTVLQVATDLFEENIPVARIITNGIYAISDNKGATLTMEDYDRLAEHPRHIGGNQIEFRWKSKPRTPTAVYHVRAITESGKIWRSHPFSAPRADDRSQAVVQVQSDTAHKPVALTVDNWLVPVVKYEFNPRCGAVLPAAAGRQFYGSLGGYVDTTMGRLGQKGGVGGTPFWYGTRNYPDNTEKTNPDWVTEDGAQCLKFDGKGNYILLPLETLPIRAGFTLAFEIKPANTQKEQTLFAHHGYYIGSLIVKIKDGKLYVHYVNDLLKTYGGCTDLVIEPGQWSKVEIVYDQSRISSTVNGKRGKAFDSPGPGMYITMSIFGGLGANAINAVDFVGNSGWFEGYLKSLEIRHTTPIKAKEKP